MCEHIDQVIVREYQKRDLPEIISLFIKGMTDSQASETYIQRSLNDDLSKLEEIYFVGRGTFLVMERISDSRIIGCAGLQDLTVVPNDTEDHGGKKLYELRRMSIHSEERRKGYGHKIMQIIISKAKSGGLDGITLFTGSWMQHAINFYEKLGFKQIGNFEFNDHGKIIVTTHLEMMFD